MSKKLLILILFAIIIIPLYLFFQNSYVSKIPKGNQNTPYITIDGHTFSLMLARTEQEKVAGLSEKTSLPQDQGMLFLFDKPSIYDFWMKRMKFPLDIIWIYNNKIVTIADELQPTTETDQLKIPRFRSVIPANIVLEINAGLAKKYNFKLGDTVTINL